MPSNERARLQAKAQYESIQLLIERLDHAGDCDDALCTQTDDDLNPKDYHDYDAALNAVLEDPLSVYVRSDWHDIGVEAGDSEFQILLCTGGPAVRITGALENGCVYRAIIEYQDWFTEWESLIDIDVNSAVLSRYSEFFFE